MKAGRKAPSVQRSKVRDLSAYRRKAMTLDAYDTMQREMEREQRERRAEVERKGRESL